MPASSLEVGSVAADGLQPRGTLGELPSALCSLAFQCQRQFCGISMLVKRRCFSCNKPGAPACKCACFFFCDGCVAGQSQVRVQHTHLCNLICASKASVKAEEESVQLL